MKNSTHSGSPITVILVGVIYLVVGLTTGALAGVAESSRMQFIWRLSAFIISAVVLAGQITYEHFLLRNPVRTTAWHSCIAAAIGGFGLALAANIHELTSASSYRPKMLIALVVWPFITAMPALIVALVLAAGLHKLAPRKAS
jgi:hypothetical protein